MLRMLRAVCGFYRKVTTKSLPARPRRPPRAGAAYACASVPALTGA